MTHSFDQLVRQVRQQSIDGDRRRYHRFRFSTHDDAAVADCVGSNLRCAHEWGWCEDILDKPRSGRFYTPGNVAQQLREIASNQEASTVRLSGMEPVMGGGHLPSVAEAIDDSLTLRIDTNGMLLTADQVERLKDAHIDIEIRLSFKGYDPSSFGKLAQVEPELFQRQLDAFRVCSEHQIAVTPVLAGVWDEEGHEKLMDRIEAIDPERADGLFVEQLRLCPANVAKLEEAGFTVDSLTE